MIYLFFCAEGMQFIEMFGTIVLISGIVAVVLNLLLPQELAEVAEEHSASVEVIDMEK